MEELNQIWQQYILPYLPMMIQVVLTPLAIKIAGSFFGNKVNSALDKRKILAFQEEAYHKTLGAIKNEIKGVTFTQNIEPLVTSALMGIQEQSIALISAKLDQRLAIDKQNAIMMKHFMDMFNNSVMSNDEKKAELQADYEALMGLIEPYTPHEITSQVIIEEPKETPKNEPQATNTLTMEM